MGTHSSQIKVVYPDFVLEIVLFSWDHVSLSRSRGPWGLRTREDVLYKPEKTEGE